jgi:hypothetical protein
MEKKISDKRSETLFRKNQDLFFWNKWTIFIGNQFFNQFWFLVFKTRKLEIVFKNSF